MINTPMSGAKESVMSNFVILVGGPGLFKGCDKAHDQTWLNYIVPLQLAAQRDIYKKAKGEKVHWVVYEPPYIARWKDDSVIDASEKKQDDGFNLHSIRKKAADKILARGAKSYIDRIKQVAVKFQITYKGIKTPDEFWAYLKSFPNESISRVWYSGHASTEGLMLALTHDPKSCEAQAFQKDMLFSTSISDVKNASVASRFSSKTKRVSKFYGCYTDKFAKKWNAVFGVASAGAKQKIDFGVINRPSNIENVMKRIEQTPTSHGATGWTQF